MEDLLKYCSTCWRLGISFEKCKKDSPEFNKQQVGKEEVNHDLGDGQAKIRQVYGLIHKENNNDSMLARTDGPKSNNPMAFVSDKVVNPTNDMLLADGVISLIKYGFPIDRNLGVDVAVNIQNSVPDQVRSNIDSSDVIAPSDEVVVPNLEEGGDSHALSNAGDPSTAADGTEPPNGDESDMANEYIIVDLHLSVGNLISPGLTM